MTLTQKHVDILQDAVSSDRRCYRNHYATHVGDRRCEWLHEIGLLEAVPLEEWLPEPETVVYRVSEAGLTLMEVASVFDRVKKRPIGESF